MGDKNVIQHTHVVIYASIIKRGGSHKLNAGIIVLAALLSLHPQKYKNNSAVPHTFVYV